MSFLNLLSFLNQVWYPKVYRLRFRPIFQLGHFIHYFTFYLSFLFGLFLAYLHLNLLSFHQFQSSQAPHSWGLHRKDTFSQAQDQISLFQECCDNKLFSKQGKEIPRLDKHSSDNVKSSASRKAYKQLHYFVRQGYYFWVRKIGRPLLKSFTE